MPKERQGRYVGLLLTVPLVLARDLAFLFPQRFLRWTIKTWRILSIPMRMTMRISNSRLNLVQFSRFIYTTKMERKFFRILNKFSSLVGRSQRRVSAPVMVEVYLMDCQLLSKSQKLVDSRKYHNPTLVETLPFPSPTRGGKGFF